MKTIEVTRVEGATKREYIVNPFAISHIVPQNSGKCQMCMQDGQRFMVDETKDELQAMLEDV